jgi:hypothetical protein
VCVRKPTKRGPFHRGLALDRPLERQASIANSVIVFNNFELLLHPPNV